MGWRLPEDASHPVHGRKIIVTRGIVHELVPEVQVVRIGDRLLLLEHFPVYTIGRGGDEANLLAGTVAGGGDGGAESGPINVNTATAGQLEDVRDAKPLAPHSVPQEFCTRNPTSL